MAEQSKAEKMADQQRRTFLAWLNGILQPAGLPTVTSLEEDLADSVLLIDLLALMEARAFHKPPVLHRRKPTSNRVRRLDNASFLFDELRRLNVKTTNIGPEDVVDGRSKLVLGLLWRLVSRYSMSGDGDHADHDHDEEKQVSAAQTALLTWCQQVTGGYKDIAVTNFTSSFQDGRAFLAIIHHAVPDAFDASLVDGTDANANLTLAFETAQRVLNVPMALQADDFAHKPDDKAVMVYLAIVKSAIEKKAADDAAKLNAHAEDDEAKAAAAEQAVLEEMRRRAEEEQRKHMAEEAERVAREAEEQAKRDEEGRLAKEELERRQREEDERRRCEEEEAARRLAADELENARRAEQEAADRMRQEEEDRRMAEKMQEAMLADAPVQHFCQCGGGAAATDATIEPQLGEMTGDQLNRYSPGNWAEKWGAHIRHDGAKVVHPHAEKKGGIRGFLGNAVKKAEGLKDHIAETGVVASTKELAKKVGTGVDILVEGGRMEHFRATFKLPAEEEYVTSFNCTLLTSDSKHAEGISGRIVVSTNFLCFASDSLSSIHLTITGFRADTVLLTVPFCALHPPVQAMVGGSHSRGLLFATHDHFRALFYGFFSEESRNYCLELARQRCEATKLSPDQLQPSKPLPPLPGAAGGGGSGIGWNVGVCSVCGLAFRPT